MSVRRPVKAKNTGRKKVLTSGETLRFHSATKLRSSCSATPIQKPPMMAKTPRSR